MRSELFCRGFQLKSAKACRWLCVVVGIALRRTGFSPINRHAQVQLFAFLLWGPRIALISFRKVRSLTLCSPMLNLLTVPTALMTSWSEGSKAVASALDFAGGG
jgi:hypothetical protein